MHQVGTRLPFCTRCKSPFVFAHPESTQPSCAGTAVQPRASCLAPFLQFSVSMKRQFSPLPVTFLTVFYPAGTCSSFPLQRFSEIRMQALTASSPAHSARCVTSINARPTRVSFRPCAALPGSNDRGAAPPQQQQVCVLLLGGWGRGQVVAVRLNATAEALL